MIVDESMENIMPKTVMNFVWNIFAIVRRIIVKFKP